MINAPIKFEVQVHGYFRGVLGGWRPAIDGDLNNTGVSAREASRSSSAAGAARIAALAMGADLGTRRTFRIVEVIEFPCLPAPFAFATPANETS